MSAMVPPMKWCGVEWPHGPHRWVQPCGMTGMYADCPGSTVCSCGHAEPGDPGLAARSGDAGGAEQ